MPVFVRASSRAKAYTRNTNLSVGGVKMTMARHAVRMKKAEKSLNKLMNQRALLPISPHSSKRMKSLSRRYHTVASAVYGFKR